MSKIPTHTLSHSNHDASFAVTSFNNAESVKAWIRAEARALGFGDCGFVSVDNPLFAKQMDALNAWLADGMHGQMAFLEQHHDKRANPALLVEGTRTIVSVRMNYLQDVPKPRTVADDELPIMPSSPAMLGDETITR